uniref:Uncharacterized protein n=1 Tax=Anopheles coluzzii TaxID=1518534 RepID=A0A8W7PHX8_ANOCL
MFWFCITSHNTHAPAGLCSISVIFPNLIRTFIDHRQHNKTIHHSGNGTDRSEGKKLRPARRRHRGLHRTGLLSNHRASDAASGGIQKSATGQPSGYQAGRNPARKHASLE